MTAQHGSRNGSRRAKPSVRAEVWERDEGCCGICGEPAEPLDWNLDHIVPHAVGGRSIADNLRVAPPAL